MKELLCFLLPWQLAHSLLRSYISQSWRPCVMLHRPLSDGSPALWHVAAPSRLAAAMCSRCRSDPPCIMVRRCDLIQRWSERAVQGCSALGFVHRRAMRR